MELIARFHSDITDPDSPITVALECRELGLTAEPAPFASPLTAAELGELRWYLERTGAGPPAPTTPAPRSWRATCWTSAAGCGAAC